MAVAVAATLVAGACGSSKFRYVADGDTNTYVKVPKSYAAFDEKEVTGAQAAVDGATPLGPLADASLLEDALVDKGLVHSVVQYRAAFDGDPSPSLEHVVAYGNSSPVVDLLVRDITNVREGVSLSTLRELFLVQIAAAQGTTEEPVLDSRVVQHDLQFENGLRGMRLIAAFPAQDGETYTFDQTALLDGKTERIYVLSIRAREREYIANYGLLDEIAKSFTVKQDG